MLTHMSLALISNPAKADDVFLFLSIFALWWDFFCRRKSSFFLFSTQSWIILRKFSFSFAETCCVLFKTLSRSIMSGEATGTHGSSGWYAQVSLKLGGSVLGRSGVNGLDSQDSCSLPCTLYSKHICSGLILDWTFPRGCTPCISGFSVFQKQTFCLSWSLNADFLFDAVMSVYKMIRE